MGAQLFHADGHSNTDGHTGMAKLIVAFRNFANAPKTIIPQHLRPQASMSEQNSKGRFLTYYLLLLSTKESRLNTLSFLTLFLVGLHDMASQSHSNLFSHFCGVNNSCELYPSMLHRLWAA
jgi:hypothetical protein